VISFRFDWPSRHNVTADPIRLFTARLDAAGHGARERTLLPRLAPPEQDRYRTFGAERRRVSWLAGRELLLSALEHALGRADPGALATAPEGGVRYTAADAHLNLSHSGDWLASVLAPFPAGVDLEQPRPRAVVQQAGRLFCSVEAAALAALPEPARLPQFYRLWTLKEAASKAAGLTVWDGLSHACFDLAARRARLAPPFPAGEWSFLQAGLAPDCLLALAWRSGAAEMRHLQRGAGGWQVTSLGEAVSLRGETALS
jgi:phosphopantetheinyl transferase